MALLDTNILVHYIREDALMRHMEARYSLMTDTQIHLISVVTEGEIRGLALQFDWGLAKRQTMERLLNYLTIVPLPYQNIVSAYAEIDDYSKRRGAPMGKNDVWIAATANVTGARLLTTDRDFDHLDSTYLQRDRIDPASV